MACFTKYGQKGGVIKSRQCIMWPPLGAYSLSQRVAAAFSMARNVGYIVIVASECK